MRTYVYVDGFNLYYRALKDTPFKWLDLKALCSLILKSHHNILKIKYFTAIVSAPPHDPQKPQRQNAYLRALQKYIPEIEIYYGSFLSHKVKAPLANQIGYNNLVEVLKTEEKGSDVNLAVHLVNDAWLDRYDCAVIISNDSDLAEALRLVKTYHKDKKLGVIVPFEGRGSKKILDYADFVRNIRRGGLKKSQLPDPIPGTNIYKPKNW
jgi:uncharacterized LabA/DUF88 family protein